MNTNFRSQMNLLVYLITVPVKFVGLIPYNRTVMCGNPIQLVCNVYGLPLPKMIWTKNGVEVCYKVKIYFNIIWSTVLEMKI